MSKSLRNHPDLREFVLENVEQFDEERVLGTGSYGSVQEVKIGGEVYAAKTIHEALLETDERGGVETIAQNYLQECQLMAHIRHPNITQFIGLCFLTGTRLPLLVMERLDSSLDDLLESTPDIPLSVCQYILICVCKGLDYLHRHFMIHRDLTARNILLTVSLNAKITDFGNSRIVHLEPGRLARTLTKFPGTLVYMPPEALSDSGRSKYGPSLDVFSFGVLQLFVLTQVFPANLLAPTYPDPNISDRLLARSEFDRRSTYTSILKRKLAGGHGHPLFVLVQQCLANAPEKRPTTSQLLSSLEEIGEDTEGGLLQLEIARVKTARALKAKDQRIEALQRELQEKDTQLAQQQREVQKKSTQLVQQQLCQTDLAAKDGVIAQKNKELAAKDERLAESETALMQQHEAFLTNLTAKDKEITQQSTLLDKKDRKIAQHQTLIANLTSQRDKALVEKEALIQAHKEQIGHKDAELAKRATVIQQLEELVRSKDNAIKERELSASAGGTTTTAIKLEKRRRNSVHLAPSTSSSSLKLPSLAGGSGTETAEGPPTPTSVDTSFYESVIDKKDLNKAMMIAMSTVLHIREVSNDDTQKRLVDYVQKVFNTDDSIVREQWRRASNTETLEPKLVCSVKYGTGLMAKDANNKRNLYVRLGIIDASFQNEHIVKTKDLLDWQKEGGIMPTGEVLETLVRKTTLEPQWNERFELKMGVAEHEMLVVEVWDSDEGGPTKIKGLKGIGTFLSDLRKGDNFMGRAFLSIWSIHDRLENKQVKLCSHSGKRRYGLLVVDLSIEQVKLNVTLEVGTQEHLMLTNAIVNHEARDEKGQYMKCWSGELSDSATTLLNKHAEFSSLKKLHKAAIRYTILMKYHRMFAVDMSTISELVKEMRSMESDLPPVESGSPNPESWVKVLYKGLNELASEIKELMNNHLTVFNVKESHDIKRIHNYIEVIVGLYSCEQFVQQLPPEKRNLQELLEKSIQVAVPNWFLVLCVYLKPEANTPEMQLLKFKTVCEHILNLCNRVLAELNPIFKLAGVDYFSQFYVALDRLLYMETVSHLERSENPDDAITYEIYRSIKDIRKLAQHIDQRHHVGLKLLQSHKWFSTKVNSWIALETKQCKEKIKKAITLDKIVQVTEDVQFSSSAADGTEFLLQLMKLDEELEWSAKAEAFALRVTIIRSVCDCAMYYMGEVVGILGGEDMFDERGKFRANEKLCIVLNNMQHMKQVLVKNLRDQFLQQQSSDGLTQEELLIQENTRGVMDTLIQSTGEDIETKISQVISQITRKIFPDMKQFIERILDNKQHTTVQETMDPLMLYLTANLRTLVNYLMSPVFQVFLNDMWSVSIDCLLSFLQAGCSGKGADPGAYYGRLKFILESVRNFFHSGGEGLSQEELENENYKHLISQLDILRLPTDKLIQTFYSQLANRQTAELNAERVPYGKILLSVGYHQDRGVVEVKLFQAQNLPGLDDSGLSDPFVELSLLPPWVFGQQSVKKQKSSIKKKTLNPVFNEDFILAASKESMRVEGAILLCTIFNRNVLRQNNLCGICVVPCVDIPFLSYVHSRKNLMLPLLRVEQNTLILKELDARAHSSDAKASEFFKNNKHILLVS